jgi:ribonuclease PH
MNIVMTGAGRLVEVQGTGEAGTFDREELDAMLDLAAKGIAELGEIQRRAIGVSTP